MGSVLHVRHLLESGSMLTESAVIVHGIVEYVILLTSLARESITTQLAGVNHNSATASAHQQAAQATRTRKWMAVLKPSTHTWLAATSFSSFGCASAARQACVMTGR